MTTMTAPPQHAMTDGGVTRDFNAIVATLAEHVRAGHATHVAQITEAMSALADRNVALRYFLFRATVDARFRRLTSAQSFYVYGCDAFYFRLNAWYPERRMARIELETELNQYFSIDSCHNHSVDFFTVGLLGPGYTTEFCHTADDLSDVGVGDTVRFDRCWNDQLSLGRALFVPKSHIFHTQYAPEAYSLSLNLIVREPVTCRQFRLADDKRTICDTYDLRDAPQEQAIDWF